MQVARDIYGYIISMVLWLCIRSNLHLTAKGLLDMRDVNGVYLFAAMNELVEEKGEGWVPYSWPKPGQAESSPKISYVVLVKTVTKNMW